MGEAPRRWRCQRLPERVGWAAGSGVGCASWLLCRLQPHSRHLHAMRRCGRLPAWLHASLSRGAPHPRPAWAVWPRSSCRAWLPACCRAGCRAMQTPNESTPVSSPLLTPPVPPPLPRLHGYKWFTSAADGEMSMALAREQPAPVAGSGGSGELTLFYVPVTRDAGGRPQVSAPSAWPARSPA